jgi:hypothetical protein
MANLGLHLPAVPDDVRSNCSHHCQQYGRTRYSAYLVDAVVIGGVVTRGVRAMGLERNLLRRGGGYTMGFIAGSTSRLRVGAWCALAIIVGPRLGVCGRTERRAVFPT